MTNNELMILRNERVAQLSVSLSQKAMICEAIQRKYGEEGIQVIREAVNQDITQWIRTVREEQHKAGVLNDLNGLHNFLWEANRDENIEFDYTDEGNIRTYKVTKCPLAEFACSNGIAQYGDLFFCSNYELIAKTYNPDISFEFVQKMMGGDKQCVFSYKLEHMNNK